MKLKWGVLGVAKIAIDQVIPAIQQSKFCDLVAIASRNGEKATKAARQFNIAKSYDSYQALLDDNDIDVVYIPLPNHLHFPWIEKCLMAGKHVLCEKPLALNVKEVKRLIKLRDKTQLKVSEAFMVKSHPQWVKVKSLIDAGEIGTLKSVNGFFSYNLTDMTNVRYVADWGGGGLYDVGCYPLFTTRYIFQECPTRVIAAIRFDEDTQVDVLTSAIIDFPKGQLTFTSAMQLVPCQVMHFYGTNKRIELKLPFNPLHDLAAVIEIHNEDIYNAEPEKIYLDTCNQYSLMCDDVSLAIMNDREVPVPLEDSLINMTILEALLHSAKIGTWVEPDYS